MPWPPASPSCTFSTTPQAAHTDHQNNKFKDTIFQKKKIRVKEKIVRGSTTIVYLSMIIEIPQSLFDQNLTAQSLIG